jgi:hypothetical protein
VEARFAELIPEAPKTPTLQVEEVPEEELALDFSEIDLLEEGEEEAFLLPEEEAEKPLEAWEEDLPEAAPLPEPEALEAWEEDLLQAEAQEALPPALEEVEGEKRPEEPPALGEAPPAPLLGVAPVPAPAQSAPLRVFRRKVDQTRLGEALAAFHRVHGVPETPLPFLLKAAERALAEVELPHRPLLGRVEGEGVRGLRPSPAFLALFHQEGGEEGEGLLCFFGEEEVHTGRPSLFLAPDGILAVSGLDAPLARKLLERVALYLEDPVLLLA